jgi:AcrR family transcriptional regulator
MFADRGYEAVTLREIARQIGYTHAVIYQHFPDKWHILAELSRETIALMVQNFDAIAAKHFSSKERLFATSRGLIQFCTAHPQQFRNVFFGPENRNGRPRWTIHQRHWRAVVRTFRAALFRCCQG